MDMMGMMLMMGMMMGNQPSELADYVDTAAYWQIKGVEVTVETMLKEVIIPEVPKNIDKLIKDLGAKDFKTREAAQEALIAGGSAVLEKLKEAVKSDDPEVSSRAQTIVEKLTVPEGEVGFRRLMAIRTLGELKDKKAVKTLKTALASKRSFEAEYAARAIAMIEGKEYKETKPKMETLREDLWLLPKGCGVVAHAPVERGGKTSLREMLKKMPGMGMEPGEMEQAIGEAERGIIQLGETVGNLRLDSVTLGLAKDIGDDTGFVVVIARGQYDRAAVLAAIKANGGEEDWNRVDGIDVDGTEVVSLEEGELNLILDRGERFILVGGEVDEDEGGALAQLPVREVVNALKSGKGGITTEPNMMKLVKEASQASGMFAVMEVSETYRQLSMLAPFKTLTLTTKTVGEEMELKLAARGEDADATTQAVEEFEEGRKQMLEEIGEAPAEMMGVMAPFVDMVKGLKVEREGGNATLTAKMKGKLSGTILMMWMMPFMMYTSPAAVEMGVDG